MKNHYSIEEINCLIKEDILYNDKTKNLLIPAKIIGLCLYENETICFDIILEDGSIFNYIPLHKVVHNSKFDEKIELKDLVYHNSKSLEITLNCFDYLKDKKGLAFLKHKNEWVNIIEYICSIDWINDNDLLNLVKLDNGYFAFLPNHKIKFCNEIKSFEKYKKLPDTYKV